jgi:hypothetical protein
LMKKKTMIRRRVCGGISPQLNRILSKVDAFVVVVVVVV